MKTIEGIFSGFENNRVALVCGRFNELITSQLVGGAVDALRRHGMPVDNISQVWVPGAYEMPFAAQKLAQQSYYDAVICLGAVIRGSTAHFDFVAQGAARGIADVSLKFDLPVVFGVLTTDTIEQALERAGTKAGNKGHEAAMTALEMIDLTKKLGEQRTNV